VVGRAEIVTCDSALSVLLKAEVRQSGMVTAMGYNTIHHKFLYSDAVEKESRKSITK
jgi:hypothetical protein